MGFYKLSEAAATDIEDIFEYGIFRFGLTQAKEYVQSMEQHFQVLSNNVGLGREAHELAQGLKRFSFGSHIIFFLPISGGILVVRILHQSMDLESHL